MQTGTKQPTVPGGSSAWHGAEREAEPRLTLLDHVFRALAALGAVEIAALAYQLATQLDAPGIIGQPYFERILLGLLVAPLVIAIGAFLLWRVPGNVVPRFIILFGLFAAVGQFDFDMGSPVRFALGLALLAIVGAGFIAPSLGYLMMHFPTGRLYPPAFGPWLKVIAAAKLLGVVLEVLATPRDIKVFQIGANPLYVPWLAPYLTLIATSVGITGVLLPLILIGGMVSLLLRYRASPPAEREQIKWVVAGFGGLLAAMLTGVVFVFSRGLDANVAIYVIPLASAALLWFVISIALAIVRHHLYGIGPLVNRTLVYGALTACVAGLYVFVVGSFGALSQTSDNLIISLLATGLIAVLFQPLRERLQRGVNHLLYGERDEPYVVLSKLGERLEATLAPDAMLPAIVESVASALKLPYAAIALETDDRRQAADRATSAGHGSPSFAAAHGRAGSMTISIPLRYQGETIGALLLAPRAGEERFTTAEMRLLNDLARQIGIAAHAARLATDLQRSRERIVSAREEERRRIRGDLHDGLGPALAALTLKLDAAGNLADRDAPATKALLAELRMQTQGAIADIRRLVYDLRPPALDELGLAAALRETATRLSGAGLHITVEAEPLSPLPAAAEVAAYRIVTEALTNVTRHAQAQQCVVRLWRDSALHIEICDDGKGMPVDARAGVGLRSMRERAAELGGEFALESPAGGMLPASRTPTTASELLRAAARETGVTPAHPLRFAPGRWRESAGQVAPAAGGTRVTASLPIQ